MSVEGEPTERNVSFTIRGEDWQLRGEVAVPVGPAHVGDLLPLARALSDAVVGEANGMLERAGESISCRKGCGACCRLLVPVAEPEARRLRAVVDALPEPQQNVVRARFAAAREVLERTGLLEPLQRADQLEDIEYRKVSRAYFEQQIPCPFLEDEACSIYAERPITCREYLVTSPAENCALNGTAVIRRVRLPLRVFNAVSRWQVQPARHVLERWVPLVLALEWADAHAEEPAARPGLELLRELLDLLTGKDGPVAEPPASPEAAG